MLSLGAVLPVIYGMQEIAASGLDPARVLCIVAGLAVGAAFVAPAGTQPRADDRPGAVPQPRASPARSR